MSQDIKCSLGLHKYGDPEIKEVFNRYGEVTKLLYISKCTNCGKIHVTYIPYESYR